MFFAMPPRVILLFALVATRAAAADRSPFLPAADAGLAGQSASGETFELAGASETDLGIRVCLYDSANKRSRWLAVGDTTGDIQVVSYDVGSNQAIVKFDGRPHILSLRKAATSTMATAYFANNAAPTFGPNRPVVDLSTIGKSPEILKQEREARMLVSDLLDIGIQQRKAYEEAARKAKAAAAARVGGATVSP